jgi:hypothetical protein
VLGNDIFALDQDLTNSRFCFTSPCAFQGVAHILEHLAFNAVRELRGYATHHSIEEEQLVHHFGMLTVE